MSRRVPIWLCAMVALVVLSGAPVFHPAAVLAASGTVSQKTPLHDSPDPAAPVIALLPEGTVVSIDGPPVDGFYPVTAGDRSGWMWGETVQVEKDRAASDDAEGMAVDPPLEETDETVPVDASAELDPAPDPAMSTTVEPASDPAAETSAATKESPPAADPALGDEMVPTAELVPADGMSPVNEPAPDLASTGDVTPVPITPDAAVPPPDSAAPTAEVAGEPTIEANVTPIPVAEVAPVGSASVMVDAPILAGPGLDYGFIATAPAGSTVEQTGHVINGYATVQYAEVTGWLALEHLGAPGTLVDQSPPAETAPVEAPLVDAPPAETSLTKTTSSDTALAETAPPETPPVETPVDAAPAEVVPVAAT